MGKLYLKSVKIRLHVIRISKQIIQNGSSRQAHGLVFDHISGKSNYKHGFQHVV